MSTNLLTPTSKPSPRDTIRTPSDFFGAEPDGSSAKEIVKRYHAIIAEPRYFQFARIPQRIIRCLERCATVRNPETIHARLLAYYLFIGVVDDGLESAEFGIGEEILKRLANPLPCFDEDTLSSKPQFMTEILKQHISPIIFAQVLRKFRELHQANLAEQHALTMRAYIKQRRLVGNLTAEISYLLVRDCLAAETVDCCRLMKDVGAVGCLVDSVIDARADKRAGTLSLRPTWTSLLFLFATTVFDGMTLVFTQPRMLPLFANAIRDNFQDRRRSLLS